MKLPKGPLSICSRLNRYLPVADRLAVTQFHELPFSKRRVVSIRLCTPFPAIPLQRKKRAVILGNDGTEGTRARGHAGPQAG
jgi:hypothetical protein